MRHLTITNTHKKTIITRNKTTTNPGSVAVLCLCIRVLPPYVFAPRGPLSHDPYMYTITHLIRDNACGQKVHIVWVQSQHFEYYNHDCYSGTDGMS